MIEQHWKQQGVETVGNYDNEYLFHSRLTQCVSVLTQGSHKLITNTCIEHEHWLGPGQARADSVSLGQFINFPEPDILCRGPSENVRGNIDKWLGQKTCKCNYSSLHFARLTSREEILINIRFSCDEFSPYVISSGVWWLRRVLSGHVKWRIRVNLGRLYSTGPGLTD